MPASDDDTTIDAAITDALANGRDEEWLALWDAVDALAGETTFATWSGADVDGTTVIDGEDRPAIQMAHPLYAAPVRTIGEMLYALGLVVGFDWPNWDGTRRYQDDPGALAEAPVGDAVRLLTAIHRSERFGDGSIEGALTSGVMQAALARLRRWYDEQEHA